MFGPPDGQVSTADHAIGLHALSLVQMALKSLVDRQPAPPASLKRLVLDNGLGVKAMFNRKLFTGDLQAGSGGVGRSSGRRRRSGGLTVHKRDLKVISL